MNSSSLHASRLARGLISRRQLLALAGLGLAGAAAGLAGCGQSANASQAGTAASAGATAAGTKNVNFGFAGDAAEESLLWNGAVAQKEGYLDDELGKAGYAATVTGFSQGGPRINEALSSGALDFAEYGDLPIYTARSQGVAIKVIGVANSRSEYGVCAGKSSGIKELKDLVGKKVVVGFGTVNHHYLWSALKKQGISIGDLELFNSASDGPSMIASGQADAFAGPLTVLNVAVNKGVGDIIASSRDDESLSSTYLYVVREQFLADEPEAATALLRALKSAYDFATKNEDKTYDDISRKSMSADQIRQAYGYDTFDNFNPQVTDTVRAKLEDLGEFAFENQLVKQKVDLDDLIDNGPYEQA